MRLFLVLGHFLSMFTDYKLSGFFWSFRITETVLLQATIAGIATQRAQIAVHFSYATNAMILMEDRTKE